MSKVEAFVLTLKPYHKADLLCQLFSKVDNGDVNIHMVSLRGQLLHTATCDTIWGRFGSLGIKASACLAMPGYDLT